MVAHLVLGTLFALPGTAVSARAGGSLAAALYFVFE